MLGTLCVAAEPIFGADELPSGPIGSPIGTWSCILYEQLAAESDSLLMRFEPDGSTQFARQRTDDFRMWAPVSAWTERRSTLSFSDSRSGREFEADLQHSSLGGQWNSDTSHGGWWCARLEDAVGGEPEIESLTAEDLMPPLVAHGSTTPFYPLQAIRQAKEGRATICFLVKSTGTIVQPEFIELSDEIFRYTTLRAVLASTYRDWTGGPAVRPGCRTFAFELNRVG